VGARGAAGPASTGLGAAGRRGGSIIDRVEVKLRHSVWPFVLIVGFGIASAVPAAQDGPTRRDAAPQSFRVGVVDRPAVEQAAAAVAPEPLEAFQKRRMGEISAIQDAIRALQKRIIDGGESLTADVREQVLAEIRQRQEELWKAEQATKDELRARAERSRPLIADHIAKVAARRGLEIVLDRSDPAVLWISPAVDVTSDVIASIRQAAPAK